jgi:hypothetical protein
MYQAPLFYVQLKRICFSCIIEENWFLWLGALPGQTGKSGPNGLNGYGASNNDNKKEIYYSMPGCYYRILLRLC